VTANRCFIQLHHPGWEHDRACAESWHSFSNDHAHQRKFLQFPGVWIEEGGQSHSDELWAWGEWEAESEKVRELNRLASGDRRLPSAVWRPRYVPRVDYDELHNTDPFIFGERFLYSNCAQRRGARGPGKSLKQLDRGSVIVFGSCVSNEWVIDTVFVVADSHDYHAASMRDDVAGLVPQAFVDVTTGPLVRNEDPALDLTLYEGATPDARVGGMFSFFPAIRSGGDTGFERPRIDLPSKYFKQTKCQGYKQTCNLPVEELREIWDSLVQQVLDAGLLLGTHAELPERRER